MNSPLESAYSISQFRRSGHQMVDMLADHLENSVAGKNPQSLPWLDPEKAMVHWEQLASGDLSFEQFCSEVIRRSVHVSDPKYMGHQVGFPAPTAMLTGLLVERAEQRLRRLRNGDGRHCHGTPCHRPVQ